jgi:release factor glutamine methyltransferase
MINQLDREILLAHVMGISRSRLLTLNDEEKRLCADNQKLYDTLIAKRVAGVCVAYLVGHKEFRYLDLEVTPDVLVPQPDTETLVEAVEEFLPRITRMDTNEKTTVLDLCTGSGCVALALAAEIPGLDVTASDISPAALAVAGRNAEKYFPELHLVQSDLFQHITKSYHLITANPPYIPAGDIAGLPPEVRGEPRLALDGGPDGLALLRRVIAEAPAHLVPGGALFVEAEDTQADAVEALCREAGFTELRRWKDLGGKRRVTSGISA